ncbi:hypothetical protein P7C73_g1992, partial [Tremellales sp. Uapishka_1]
MKENGVAHTILSLTAPGIQDIESPEEAAKMARTANDWIYAEMEKANKANAQGNQVPLFSGFASLSMHDPKQAAEELRYCVEKLGFVGSLVNNNQRVGEDKTAWYDGEEWDPFWKTCTDLNVPFYLHPIAPKGELLRDLYKTRPSLIGPVLSFANGVSTHLMDLIANGVFDRHPKLQVIVGHLGEHLPFDMWRINHWLEEVHRPRGNVKMQKTVRDYFAQNIWITTSGHFSTSTLEYCMTEVGVERILFRPLKMLIAAPTKPILRDYVPKPSPTEDLDYASLKTLDLSLMDSGRAEDLDKLVATCEDSMVNCGFLYLKNHGLSLEEFQIAQHVLVDDTITGEEKRKFAQNQKSGSFAGYKPKGEWHLGGGAFRDVNLIPETIKPFMDEIVAFLEKVIDRVQRRLLLLLSRVLEMPDDYLWNTVHSSHDVVGEGYFRHMLYHPMSPEQRKLSGGRMMTGHVGEWSSHRKTQLMWADFGTTTLLFSQPIAALQILSFDDVWRYVKYEPGSIIVNLGECFEALSGFNFKATRHRVYTPPPSQMDMQRLGLVLFNQPDKWVTMGPLLDSPFVQARGYRHRFQDLVDAGKEPMTAGMWKASRVADYKLKDTDVVKDKHGKEMRVMTVHGVTMKEYL